MVLQLMAQLVFYFYSIFGNQMWWERIEYLFSSSTFPVCDSKLYFIWNFASIIYMLTKK